MNASSPISDPNDRPAAAGNVAGRPSSDRLSLSGRVGSGVVDHRSDFVQMWLLGGELPAEELRSALGDLEHAARAAEESAPAEEAAPEPGSLPLAVRQFVTGLGFLREHLWGGGESGAPALAGLLVHDGRLWALRAGVPARLDQMTGAPARIPWHEPRPGGLAWCEADAREVWRVELAGPGGMLAAHYRPPLVSVLGTMRDEAMSDSSTPHAPMPEAMAPHDDDGLEIASGTDAAPEPDLEAGIAPGVEVAALEADVAPEPEPGTLVSAPATAVPPALARPRVLPPRSIATPRAARPAWPAWPAGSARLPWVLAGVTALAVLVLLAVWAREPVSNAIVGRYDLALTTRPAGATVRVDGELVPGRTPLTVALVPGEHRVELTYGEYANAVLTVDGDRGESLRRDFAWTGSVAVSSADTTADLSVSFDGKPWGALPLWRDDVPVGVHRLSFQGKGVRPWEEEVKVRTGQSTRIVAEPVRVPDYGLVTARAERVSREGVEDVEGASVFVDGKPAGGTPLDLHLSPGAHSVRIASGSELGPVHLIDVQAGGRFYASTTFGRPAEPAVVFAAPTRLSRAAPPVLAVRLEAGVPLPVRRMRLFVRGAGAAKFDAIDLDVVRDEGRPRGTIRFPVAGLAAGSTVRYYVAIETREGEEYFSEVRTAVVTP